MGYRLFELCLRQLLRNWWVAVRLSWFWLLATLLAGSFLSYRYLGNAFPADQPVAVTSWLAILLSVAIFLVVYVIAFATIAIGWHRFVLREERPDRFYVMRTGWPVGRYLWRSFLLALIMMAGMLPLTLVVSLLIGSTIGGSGIGPENYLPMLIAYFALTLLIGVPSTWLVLRIGLVLPATAIGENLSFAGSFRLTRPISGSLAITALCVVLLGLVPRVLQISMDHMDGAAAAIAAAILVVVWLAFSWIMFFVGFGLLTVTYGHLAENRPV